MAHGQGGAEIGFDHGPTLTCNHEAPIVAHSLRAEGFDASEDGTGRGTPIVPVPPPAFAFDLRGREGGAMPEGPHDTANLRAASGGSSRSYVAEPIAFDCLSGGETALSVGEVPGALHGVARSAVAFSSKDYGADAADEVSPTLRAMGHAESHANAGGQLAVAYGLATSVTPKFGVEVQPTLTVPSPSGGGQPPAVAFAQNQRDEVRTMDVAGALAAEPGMKQQTYLALPWAVRRLTPVECERLQGATDGHTMIPWRGRDAAPDGPRYKSLGNSMARNAMEWIGERIGLVEEISPAISSVFKEGSK